MLKVTATVLYFVTVHALLIHGFTVYSKSSHKLVSSVTHSGTSYRIVTRSRGSAPYDSSLALNSSENSNDPAEATDRDEDKKQEGNEVKNDDGEISQDSEQKQREKEEEEEEEAIQVDSKVEEDIEAIKKEISNLESQLKSKNRELDSIEKMAEQYTKGGYARKVAEMEEIKKVKTAASADNKVTARASVLKTFLPVVDELKVLTDKYESDEFAKKYAALSRDFNNALKDMGVEEFMLAEGDSVDATRVEVVRQEHSDSVAKGSVMEALSCGYELSGNIMRKAQAVVSLGPKEEMKQNDLEEKVGEQDGDDTNDDDNDKNSTADSS